MSFSLIGCWETEGKENKKLVCVSENLSLISLLVSVAFFKVSRENLEILFPYFFVYLLRKWRKRNKRLLCQWNLNVISLLASIDFEEIIEILFLHSLFVCWETKEKENFVCFFILCFFILYLFLQRCRQHNSTPSVEAPRLAQSGAVLNRVGFATRSMAIAVLTH